MSKTRIKYIDIAKCIGISLVVYNHFQGGGCHACKMIIAAFHMPLFFMLSGITMKSCDSVRQLACHIIKRLGQLIIPVYLWFLVFCHPINIKNLALLLYGSNLAIGRACGPMAVGWFFPAMFIADTAASVLIYAAKKVSDSMHKERIIIISGICVYALASWMLGRFIDIGVDLPWSFDVALSGAAFILIGNQSSELLQKIDNTRLRNKVVGCILMFAVTAAFAAANTAVYDNDYGRVVMALGKYGYYPLFFVGGIVGSVFCIMLSMVLQNICKCRLALSIGRHTLVMLIIHQRFIQFVENRLFNQGMSELYVIVFTIVTVMLSYLFALIVSNVCPNFSGNGNLKKVTPILE